jgi:hypothetical protein
MPREGGGVERTDEAVKRMNLKIIPNGAFSCATHDFILDEKGHECSRCGLREEIVRGQKFVIDPRMPKGEIHLKQNGVTVGRIVNIQ